MCTTHAGSSALYSARNLVAGGLARCVLALGFEKMQKGSLQLDDPGDVNPLGETLWVEAGSETFAYSPVPPPTFATIVQLFGIVQ